GGAAACIDGIDPGEPTEQAHAFGNLSIRAEFDALIALLTVFGIHVAHYVCAGLRDTEQGERAADIASIILRADFVLLRFVGGERLAGVGKGTIGAGLGRRSALNQCFDVIGIERNLLPRLDHESTHGRYRALVIGTVWRERTCVVVVAILLNL